MLYTSETFEQLIDVFSQFPGIGRKSAQRLAMHVLKIPRDEVKRIAQVLLDVHKNIKHCSICWNYTDHDPCSICSNVKRDCNTICIVEEPNDMIALEKTNEYHGLYHILGGVLSPLNGIGPEDLKINELLKRVSPNLKEIIIALDPNIEGEATTIYLTRLLKPLGVKLTRLARGIPIGSDLEFADEATLVKALEGRVSL